MRCTVLLSDYFTFVQYGINYHLKLVPYQSVGLILFLGAAARAPAESECETATFLSETRTRTMNRASCPSPDTRAPQESTEGVQEYTLYDAACRCRCLPYGFIQVKYLTLRSVQWRTPTYLYTFRTYYQ